MSAEVAATDFDGMMDESEKLADIASNVTLCLSANQALLAAKAGAADRQGARRLPRRLEETGQTIS